jgi:hypothetical protein
VREFRVVTIRTLVLRDVQMDSYESGYGRPSTNRVRVWDTETKQFTTMGDLDTLCSECRALDQFVRTGDNDKPTKMKNVLCKSSDGVSFNDWEKAIEYANKHDVLLKVKGRMVYHPRMGMPKNFETCKEVMKRKR